MRKIISEIFISIIILTLTITQSSCNQPTNNRINNIMYDNIKEIRKNGYFKDSNDKTFNEYITSDHFEVFYDKNNALDEIYAKSVIQELFLMYENNKHITMTAVHEFVHCVTFNFAYSDTIPNWLFEGLAMYLSQDKDRYEDSYKQFAELGFPSFYKLNDYSNKYIYGYSLVEYIDTEFGREKLLDLLKSGNGDIEKVLQISENEFREGWEIHISKKVNL